VLDCARNSEGRQSYQDRSECKAKGPRRSIMASPARRLYEDKRRDSQPEA